MRLEKIFPCVCIKYQLDSCVSSEYGMPILRVSEGQWYRAYCPRCGRGDTLSDFKSPYLALKSWNEIMEHGWKNTWGRGSYDSLPKLGDPDMWELVNAELEEWR